MVLVESVADGEETPSLGLAIPEDVECHIATFLNCSEKLRWRQTCKYYSELFKNECIGCSIIHCSIGAGWSACFAHDSRDLLDALEVLVEFKFPLVDDTQHMLWFPTRRSLQIAVSILKCTVPIRDTQRDGEAKDEEKQEDAHCSSSDEYYYIDTGSDQYTWLTVRRGRSLDLPAIAFSKEFVFSKRQQRNQRRNERLDLRRNIRGYKGTMNLIYDKDEWICIK